MTDSLLVMVVPPEKEPACTSPTTFNCTRLLWVYAGKSISNTSCNGFIPCSALILVRRAAIFSSRCAGVIDMPGTPSASIQ